MAEDSGQPLFLETGVLWLGRGDDAHVDGSERILGELGVPTEPLTRDDVAARFPQLDLGGAARAVLEPGGGVLLARRAVRAAADRARRRGVDCRTASVAAPGPGRRVDALALGDGSRLSAGAFVFACGPWLPRLFPRLLDPLLRVTRQEVFFLGPPAGDGRFRPPALPVWIDFQAGAYGLPDIEGRGVKIGLTALGPAFDPDRGDRTPSAAGLSAARQVAAARLPALRGAPLLETRVCQYTNTPSGDLLLDRHPDHANVWLAGGGSGHGFKLGPAVGAYVAAQVAASAPAEDLVTLAAHRAGGTRTVL